MVDTEIDGRDMRNNHLLNLCGSTLRLLDEMIGEVHLVVEVVVVAEEEEGVV